MVTKSKSKVKVHIGHVINLVVKPSEEFLLDKVEYSILRRGGKHKSDKKTYGYS